MDEKRCQVARQCLMQGATLQCKFTYGESKAEKTYGYPTCSLKVFAVQNGVNREVGRVAYTCGGGYNLSAACVITFITNMLQPELVKATALHNDLNIVMHNGKASLFTGLSSEQEFKTILNAVGVHYAERFNSHGLRDAMFLQRLK